MLPSLRFNTLVAVMAVHALGTLATMPWNLVAGPRKEAAVEIESEPESADKPRGERQDKVVKSDAEWRKILTREQFRVTRRKGTETPFKGAYWKTKKDGVYQCVCCGEPLFDSTVKYDSGTGWPSFWEPIDKDAVSFHEDRSQRKVRTEVRCSRCDAHLGHVFEDGPPPTGRRFCMNSVALRRVDRKPTSAKGSSPRAALDE